MIQAFFSRIVSAFSLSLQQAWYRETLGWSILFLPLHTLFVCVSAIRRQCFRLGIFRREHLPVPVVVIGNLSVGGTGKTPLTQYLARALNQAGHRVGIISRGYGGWHVAPCAVYADSDPEQFGDEPVLLAQKTGCPVFVGKRRVEAARALLQAFPEVTLLISDDGLQHEALARALEIVVMDGARGVGNGWRLPVGPLREGVARLQSVDALVVNGEVTHASKSQVDSHLPRSGGHFLMHLIPKMPYRVHFPHEQRAISAFEGECEALAAIANPDRFFRLLTTLGVSCRGHPFPDHYAFSSEDLACFSSDRPIFVTEKDAVKLKFHRLGESLSLWALPVEAEVSPDCVAWILSRLKGLEDES